jgi:hypothetical protein
MAMVPCTLIEAAKGSRMLSAGAALFISDAFYRSDLAPEWGIARRVGRNIHVS